VDFCSRIYFIYFFCFELFKQLDNQALAYFDLHVFRVNAYYLDPTSLGQGKNDKTPKLISINYWTSPLILFADSLYFSFK